MPIYKITDSEIHFIKEQTFKLEKEIQNICEKNLDKLLSIVFIKSEFRINEFRIDSLAYDEKSKSFIIIEYKRDKNFSVIDQGYAYLSLMLNNKADFILEYNESTGESLKRTEVDWSQSKVIFIAPSFTNYQKEAINFKDLPIELWEIKKYSNNTISFKQIVTKGSIESISTITKPNDEIGKVIKEIKVYKEEDHLACGSQEIVELYLKLRNYILEIANDIEIKPTKLYLAFLNITNFCDISILKKSLKIWINLNYGELKDPKTISRNVADIGHHGNGDYEIQISNDENLEYITSLIKDAYYIIKERNKY